MLGDQFLGKQRKWSKAERKRTKRANERKMRIDRWEQSLFRTGEWCAIVEGGRTQDHNEAERGQTLLGQQQCRFQRIRVRSIFVDCELFFKEFCV